MAYIVTETKSVSFLKQKGESTYQLGPLEEEFSEISEMYIGLHVKYTLLLADFNKTRVSRQIF